MSDKEIRLIALSEKLFDLYETKRNISLLNSPQGYEDRKKAYIDNALLQMKIDLAEQQLKEIST